MISKQLVQLIVLGAFAALSVGCVQKGKPMYNWCDYSDSLYSCKKDEAPENLAKHQAVLERIIAESNERSMRVPPGVCAELGYVYAAQNRKQEAIGLFQQEKQTYPESALLMDRLISKVEIQGSLPSDSKPASDENALKQEKTLGGSKP